MWPVFVAVLGFALCSNNFLSFPILFSTTACCSVLNSESGARREGEGEVRGEGGEGGEGGRFNFLFLISIYF